MGQQAGDIGRCCAAVAIAVALAVCGVLPAWADDVTIGNRVFFRGGVRGPEQQSRQTNCSPDGHSTLGTGPTNDGSTGYYVGAGTELMLSHDVWGMMKNIAVLGEIGVEFKRWDSSTVANSDTPPVTGVSTGGQSKVQMTMLTVNVSPKVKFMQGERFPTLGHPGRDGFSRHQPAVEPDPVLGRRGAIRHRGGISDLERALAWRGWPIPRGLQSNQHREQLRHGRRLCRHWI